jgi:hypothetical protein
MNEQITQQVAPRVHCRHAEGCHETSEDIVLISGECRAL